jgi:hypothetical protein
LELQVLFKVIHQRTGYEVVQHDESPNTLVVYGRIPRGIPPRVNWDACMRHVFDYANDAKSQSVWKVDFSQYHFRDEARPGRMRWAWRLKFVAKGVAQFYPDIARVFGAVPRPHSAEVEEVMLPGASANRNSTAGGKRGAGLSGTVLVGPAAVFQKQQGG